MSAVLSLWFSVVLLLLCGSSEGLENITKKPGENVILTCRTEKSDGLIVLEWSREDLGDKKVFVYRGGKPFPSVAHESYRNRVFLKDSQMKDGDLSVVLKNVTMNDTGTYECRVLKRRTKRSNFETPPISTIHLSVDPPGDPSPGDPSPGQQGQQGGREEGGDKKGSSHHLGLIVLLVPVVVVAVVLWIYKKKKGPNQSSSGSNNQQNPEQDFLNSD